MLDTLIERIDKAIQKLKGVQNLTEANVTTSIKEICRALVIDADVNYKIARRVTDEIKKTALKRKVTGGIDAKQVFMKVAQEKLTELMGGETKEINLEGSPVIVLLAGLKKAGKTRFAGKLASYLKKQKGKRVLLVACDVPNPNVQKELQEIGEWVEAAVYTEPENKESLEVAQNAIRHANEYHYDVVILDTVGSATIDEAWLAEIKSLQNAIQPTETLFVADATTGQKVINTARIFLEQISFDGVVLTKLDLDTKGGAILSTQAMVNKPVKYISTGEKMADMRLFDPENMSLRILDMNDVQKYTMICGEPSGNEVRILRNNIYDRPRFDFKSFLNCLKLSDDDEALTPYMRKVLGKIDVIDEEINTIEAMIDSMTFEERHNPMLLKEPRRRKRISQGSGTSIQQVNHMMKQFVKMRKLLNRRNRSAKRWNPFE